VEWIIQYRVKNAKNYLFHVGGHPNVHIAVADLIRDVSEAVMRRLVGDRSVDEAITTGRDEIAAEAERLCQELLDEYEAGVEVIFVKLQSATPPEPVKDAFDNVNRARQAKEQIINQARGERNKQVPAARGKRDRAIAEAEGYRERITRSARGQANAFLSKFAEYEKAPKITRMRLYLETMEEVIGQVKELVVIDEEVRGVLPLLNLDAPQSVTKGGGLR
jgi:membrane protease subunit HflK